MTQIAQFILFAATFFVASTHAADLRDYRCTVEHVMTADLKDKGLQSELLKTYANKEFAVERASGLMAGTLKNSFVTKPQVIDIGSSENSYKVVTTMRSDQGAGRGSNIYSLVVQEYAEGKRKPFVFLDSDLIFFGTCVHF